MIANLLALALLAPDHTQTADLLRKKGLVELGAHRYLTELTGKVGARVSGSPGAAKAVIWVQEQMRNMGLQNIKEIPCMVPHWVRGAKESAEMTREHGFPRRLSLCALGGSVATPSKGIEAEVIEVQSNEEAANLGERGKGKIVFLNRGFDATLPATFSAYGGAVNQRGGGASAAAKSGAVAVLVRSMTLAKDDAPHTGAMRYAAGVEKIPAAALGIQSADRLSEALKKGRVRVRITLNCQTLPDVPSANVAGEIVGSEFPNEIIAIGGHLDSWDLGKGAHDDGAGIVQALEALRLMKELGLKPKRTIRAVAWMDEEYGGRGAQAYAEMAKNAPNKHIAALESDSGGFMPREFGVTEKYLDRVRPWEAILRQFGIERFSAGGADADNGPLGEQGTVLFALIPENQRYFDVHHSRNDVIENVNARELEMGALAEALLIWMISEEGI